MKYFKTQSLDEAVFLTINGIFHEKIRVMGQIHTEWTFPESRKRRSLSDQFWTGSPMVALDKWLVIRQQLKFEQKNRYARQRPKKTTTVKQEMLYPNGTTYWFVNGRGDVQSAFYGKAKSHNKRHADGNFFLNRIQAVQKQNEIKGT